MAKIEWKTKEEIEKEKEEEQTDLELLKKQQTDLIFALMEKGVL